MAHFISLNDIYSNCLVNTPSGTVNTVTSYNTELSYALERVGLITIKNGRRRRYFRI